MRLPEREQRRRKKEKEKKLKREKTTATLLILLMAALVAPMAFAPRPAKFRSAEKATGSFWAVSGKSLVYLEFNAHEAVDGRPAKGQLHWYRDHPTHGDRDLWCVVKYVDVVDNQAWLAAYCEEDTAGKLTYWWLYLIVLDDGTPGSQGDYIKAMWFRTETEAETAVIGHYDGYWGQYWLIDGNLVVHTYD